MKLIKDVHRKHSAHEYRWINAFIHNQYGILYSDYVHRLCKYEGIKAQGYHYQWQKPGEEQYKFDNLIWYGWSNLTKPLHVMVSDRTAFYVKNTYYE